MEEAFRNMFGNLFIIMEYFKDGNLLDKRKEEMKDRESPYYSEQEVITIFTQICKGVSYIHGKGAAHRDLDPKNIMIQNGVIKIVDFGLAMHLNIDSNYKNKTSQVGKFKYMAPEVFNSQDYNAQRADIFSLGCVLYFLMTGKEDFNGYPLSSLSAPFDKLKKLVIPDIYTDALR